MKRTIIHEATLSEHIAKHGCTQVMPFVRHNIANSCMVIQAITSDFEELTDTEKSEAVKQINELITKLNTILQ